MKKESFMKKLGMTAVLLTAGVVAASGVFAQEIKFDGVVNTGIGIITTDTKVADGTGAKTADTKVVPYAVDAGQSGYRFRLNGSYTSEDGNTGAKFRLQAQSKFDSGALSIPYAYGWASFLNKLLTVTGGLVDDSSWATSGPLFGDDAGEGLGTLIKLSPIPGLNLGVGAYVISQQSGGSNNVLIVPAGDTTATTDLSKVDIGLDRLKYTISAGYTLPDLLKLTIAFRTANQAGDTTSKYPNAAEQFKGRDETSKLIFGAKVLAVKDLTAELEVVADKLEDTGEEKDLDNIDLDFYETLGYKLGSLAFGLNAAQNIRLEKDKDNDFGLHINPWVSYAIGSIVPRLDLNYYMAGTALATGGETVKTAYNRTVFAYKNNGDADDFSVIGVRPSVKFNVGKGSIEVGDFIAYAMGPENAFGNAADAKSSNFSNVFYADFKWSF
jgi:hypothetical protein